MSEKEVEGWRIIGDYTDTDGTQQFTRTGFVATQDLEKAKAAFIAAQIPFVQKTCRVKSAVRSPKTDLDQIILIEEDS